MAKITFEDKEQINTYPDIPVNKKCTADDMNEIKRVINENDSICAYQGTCTDEELEQAIAESD